MRNLDVVPSLIPSLHHSQLSTGFDWAHFADIKNEQTNLAVLQRPKLEIEGAVAELLQSDFECFQVSMSRDDDPMLIGCYLDDDLALESPEAGTLYLDIVKSLTQFFHISDAKEVGIQLEAIRTDMCALFHFDLLRLRMVCTYSGPGTEWLRNEDVNRNGLMRGCNDLVRKPGAQIQKLGLHHIALMKGEKYHAEPGRSLIHRSPTISDRGIERLFLRMDVLS